MSGNVRAPSPEYGANGAVLTLGQHNTPDANNLRAPSTAPTRLCQAAPWRPCSPTGPGPHHSPNTRGGKKKTASLALPAQLPHLRTLILLCHFDYKGVNCSPSPAYISENAGRRKG